MSMEPSKDGSKGAQRPKTSEPEKLDDGIFNPRLIFPEDYLPQAERLQLEQVRTKILDQSEALGFLAIVTTNNLSEGEFSSWRAKFRSAWMPQSIQVEVNYDSSSQSMTLGIAQAESYLSNAKKDGIDLYQLLKGSHSESISYTEQISRSDVDFPSASAPAPRSPQIMGLLAGEYSELDLLANQRELEDYAQAAHKKLEYFQLKPWKVKDSLDMQQALVHLTKISKILELADTSTEAEVVQRQSTLRATNERLSPSFLEDSF